MFRYFIAALLVACTSEIEERIEAHGHKGAIGPSENEPVDESESWLQPHDSDRPDQAELSSHRPCYCFPRGPECHADPWTGGERNAPAEVPPCPDGEVCYAHAAWYSQGFDRPLGTCMRVCFHARAQLTADVSAVQFARYLEMNCAPTEQCRLIETDVGFEGVARGSVGMCVRVLQEPLPEPYPKNDSGFGGE